LSKYSDNISTLTCRVKKLKSVELVPSGVHFPVQENQSILEAALANNINLEYSCSNGRCGKCKAIVVEGSVDQATTPFESVLLPDEILTCSSTPQNNLVLKANYFPELDHIKRKTFPSKVDAISFPKDNIMILDLRLPDTANFVFLPGQYLDLIWMGNKRSYSIASSCIIENKIQLHIKKVEKGLFSHFLFNQLQHNQLLRFYAPLGTFFLRDTPSPIIFLCTGTGFAPVKSMVESLLQSGSKRQIYIYWGGRISKDLYSDLPVTWATQYDHIHFVSVLSRENQSLESELSSASNTPVKYVQQAATQRHSNMCEFEVYACGSEQMIHDAQKLLIKHGLKSENFYSDAFLPSN